jgi:hypothetical protein
VNIIKLESSCKYVITIASRKSNRIDRKILDHPKLYKTKYISIKSESALVFQGWKDEIIGGGLNCLTEAIKKKVNIHR